MRATAIIIFFFVTLLSFSAASRYPKYEFPERIDAEGARWVGPIRLAPVGSTDEQLNNFTAKTIELLKPKIAAGFPEYGFPAVDPFTMQKFDYEQKFGPVKVVLATKNIRIEGFSKFKNLTLKTDTQNKRLYFNMSVPKLHINAVYKAGGSAVLFPITGSGPANVNIDNLRTSGYMSFGVVSREDGVEIVEVKKTVVEDMKFERINARIQGLFGGNPILSATTHYFVNNFGPELFNLFLKNRLSTSIAQILTEDIVNPFIYNMPQFAEYIQ